jgi:hypothetical protein
MFVLILATSICQPVCQQAPGVVSQRAMLQDGVTVVTMTGIATTRSANPIWRVILAKLVRRFEREVSQARKLRPSPDHRSILPSEERHPMTDRASASKTDGQGCGEKKSHNVSILYRTDEFGVDLRQFAMRTGSGPENVFWLTFTRYFLNGRNQGLRCRVF